ncbi:carboxymethylenebutenolidase [Frankia sp. EI5c]|uniref:dienelactone hydrolase family protein n=1 Tax=Frankia sp. EI5c TaxID=683316 RepID=UPI0007C3350B|nr:dienelactone hydrolase family protein [Frankia sp. EI5c]OAA29035.1 carboxymethylenebutenolidase [Frankia sp. EI5c]
MAVSRREVATPDGTMEVFLQGPADGAPAPVVIMIPDAYGVRDTVLEMAGRLAAAGYLTAVPNIFHRSGPATTGHLEINFADPAQRARLGEVVGKATPAAVMADLGALLDVLASDPAAEAGPVGVIGYCIGGRMAFTAATAFGERVAAAASIHGGGLATEDPSSPYLAADGIRAEVYVAAARDDAHHTAADHARLLAALDEAKVDYTAEVLPALHGFAMVDFPVYDESAARRHWEMSLALFARTLRPAG